MRAAHRSESELVVFISSVMSPELESARRLAVKTVDSIDVGRPWAFEYTPASSQSPQDEYLSEVRKADFVIWLVGQETTAPVADEINECMASNGRLLVFKLPAVYRDTRTQDLLAKIENLAKWKDIEHLADLSEQMKAAISDEISRALRDPFRPIRDRVLTKSLKLSVSNCKKAWESAWRSLGYRRHSCW